MNTLNAIRMGGVDVLPLIEGGKGIGVSTGVSTGHWAETGGAGTFSAVNADYYDAAGNPIEQTYAGRTRRERHEELIQFGIQGGIAQAKRAWEISGGRGRIHANILWEMGGAERVISGVLEGAKGLIHGLTCGAGMPYRLSDIAAKFGVHYYPIVSSSRAFNALWKRAYSKAASLLGGVVYEDPWLAGGHNGLSNGEDPAKPEDPYPRVLALRKLMRTFGLDQVPIIMAGGVWWLEEWQDWIDNDELGPIAFQFGTRPLLTQESPISDAWKRRLLTLKAGDVFLNKFSPTGFYSSAVNNGFIEELRTRRRTHRHPRHRPPQAPRLPHPPGPVPRRGLDRRRLHRSHAHPRQHPRLRHPRARPADHRRPSRLHGLPQRLPLQQLEPARARLRQRQEGRPPQLLHPEDPPGGPPRRPNPRGHRAPADVQRP